MIGLRATIFGSEPRRMGRNERRPDQAVEAGEGAKTE